MSLTTKLVSTPGSNSPRCTVHIPGMGTVEADLRTIVRKLQSIWASWGSSGGNSCGNRRVRRQVDSGQFILDAERDKDEK